MRSSDDSIMWLNCFEPSAIKIGITCNRLRICVTVRDQRCLFHVWSLFLTSNEGTPQCSPGTLSLCRRAAPCDHRLTNAEAPASMCGSPTWLQATVASHAVGQHSPHQFITSSNATMALLRCTCMNNDTADCQKAIGCNQMRFCENFGTTLKTLS